MNYVVVYHLNWPFTNNMCFPDRCVSIAVRCICTIKIICKRLYVQCTIASTEALNLLKKVNIFIFYVKQT